MSLVLLATGNLSAQTPEDVQASKERCEKLEKMEAPDKVGVEAIDQLADEATAMLQEALAITQEIEKFNARLRGEEVEGEEATEAEEGEIFPSEKHCEALLKRIEKQGTAAASLGTTALNALQDVKKLKSPIKIAKGTKSLKYSQAVVKLVAEEAVYQAKATTAILQTVKETVNAIAG
ncbi:hypothetical protein D0T60_12025 [Bacteroides sp. 224]|nr:hypothetical protein [Bacteroides sp. 224]